MTCKTLTDTACHTQARTDVERLRSADQALALIEDDIRGLELDGDDLAYLMDVLRLGVQRALDASQDQSEPVTVHALSESRH